VACPVRPPSPVQRSPRPTGPTHRAEVTRRSRKEPSTMTATICLPTTELISIDAMASVDTALWQCPALRPARHDNHPAHSALRGRRAPERPAPRHDRHRPRLSSRSAPGGRSVPSTRLSRDGGVSPAHRPSNPDTEQDHHRSSVRPSCTDTPRSTTNLNAPEDLCH
jgi:hypothetical protein